MRSQAGPLASIPFTVFPTDRSCRIDPQPFRILLLRRLRPPTPFNCAFVRVWPSPRQLGPPSLGLLSCWGPLDEGHFLWRTTLVSPIRRDGIPRPRAHEVNGIALKHGSRHKETTYPEFAGRSGRARLVVIAKEVGGRFSSETAQFLSDLAWAKTRGVSDFLRGRARSAWTRRWSAIMGCAAARVFATSLLDGSASVGVDGPTTRVWQR